MFRKNVEIFLRLRFSITHPNDPILVIAVNKGPSSNPTKMTSVVILF